MMNFFSGFLEESLKEFSDKFLDKSLKQLLRGFLNEFTKHLPEIPCRNPWRNSLKNKTIEEFSGEPLEEFQKNHRKVFSENTLFTNFVCPFQAHIINDCLCPGCNQSFMRNRLIVIHISINEWKL